MTPINDPRPFAEVLQDWIARHGGSAYAAAPLLDTTERTVGRWLAGAPCSTERAHRALMLLIDRGEA